MTPPGLYQRDPGLSSWPQDIAHAQLPTGRGQMTTSPAGTVSSQSFIGFGAGEKSGLEPFASAEFLDELEDWSSQIASDPVVCRAVAALDAFDDGDDEEYGFDDEPPTPMIQGGPRR